MASLNPFHYIKAGVDKIYHPDGNQAGPAGVGGRAELPDLLQRDPQTGLYYDPSTGTSYVDSSGQVPVKDPNVAQQVASSFATRNSLLGNAAQDRGTIGQAQAGQFGLAGSLRDIAAGRGGPSAASIQLSTGSDQIGRDQLAASSGVGGPNAAAARRLALNNIAGQQTQLNGQQALLRAKESEAARGQLGQVLGQIAGQGINQYGQNLAGAQGFGQQAMSGAGINQAALIDKQKAADSAWAGLLNSGLSAGATALTGKPTSIQGG